MTNRPIIKSEHQIQTERYKNDLFIKGCYDQLRIIYEQSPIELIIKEGEIIRRFKPDEQLAIDMIYKCMNKYIKNVYSDVIYITNPDK